MSWVVLRMVVMMMRKLEMGMGVREVVMMGIVISVHGGVVHDEFCCPLV